MNQSAATGPITLYPKRRVQMERAKGLSHLAPAMVLLGGMLGVMRGTERFTLLLAIELVVGAAYLLLLVRELRHLRHHPNQHERVAWLELAAAGILALEGYHLWHRYHEKELLTGEHKVHILHWLYATLAVWYVFMAFGLGRLHERRHLHLHAEGFSGRLHPFGRRFAYTWDELDRLEPNGSADVVVHHTNGGQRHLSFKSILAGPALRDQLLAHGAGRPAAAGAEAE
jgi:hypothetical protein